MWSLQRGHFIRSGSVSLTEAVFYHICRQITIMTLLVFFGFLSRTITIIIQLTTSAILRMAEHNNSVALLDKLAFKGNEYLSTIPISKWLDLIYHRNDLVFHFYLVFSRPVSTYFIPPSLSWWQYILLNIRTEISCATADERNTMIPSDLKHYSCVVKGNNYSNRDLRKWTNIWAD
jgi:hypothetical protein